MKANFGGIICYSFSEKRQIFQYMRKHINGYKKQQLLDQSALFLFFILRL